MAMSMRWLTHPLEGAWQMKQRSKSSSNMVVVEVEVEHVKGGRSSVGGWGRAAKRCWGVESRLCDFGVMGCRYPKEVVRGVVKQDATTGCGFRTTGDSGLDQFKPRSESAEERETGL